MDPERLSLRAGVGYECKLRVLDLDDSERLVGLAPEVVGRRDWVLERPLDLLPFRGHDMESDDEAIGCHLDDWVDPTHALDGPDLLPGE